MNLEDEKSWSFFMPQVKLSLLAGILLQQPPSREGGARQHALLVPHMRLEWVVQGKH